MKFMVFALLAIAIASGIPVENESRVCVPGTERKQDCNKCVCSEDGKSEACTFLPCPGSFGAPRMRRSMGTPKNGCLCHGNGSSFICESSNCEKQICNSGARWMKDCNSCSCSDDGRSETCTTRECSKVTILAPSEYGTVGQGSLRVRREVDVTCEPGKSFMNYCNECHCGTDSKTASCTLMACDEKIWNEDGSRKDQVSVAAPGVDETVGQGSLRTRREVDVTCEPGKSFMNYCNECHCSTDGKTASCTLMACDKTIWNEDGSRKDQVAVAAPGVDETVGQGSLRMRRQTDVICQPGTSFMNACNECRCGTDGKTFACTRMACDPRVWNQDGTVKVQNTQ